MKSEAVPEAIKHPRGFSVCEDGSILVCDTWSHRVMQFTLGDATDKPTVLAGTSNSCGNAAEKLAFPSVCLLCPDGSILVTDTNNHRVQRFEPGQTVATTVAGSKSGQSGSGPGELNMPTGLCLDPSDGSFLVADRVNGRVLRFPADSRAGDAGEVIAGPELLQRPWGVCLGQDGSIYVSDERQAVVLKLGSVTAGSAPAKSAPKSNMIFAPPPRSVPTAPATVPPPLADVASASVATRAENPMELD